MAKKTSKQATKVSKAESLRALTNEEINKKVEDMKQELFQLRLQAAVGKLENTAQVSKIKKEIARCYTVLTERANN